MTPALPALTSESDLRIDPSEPVANRSPLVPWKFTVTTGEPANDGAVAPSMVTVSVIAGSEVRPIRIVPATPKSIVSAPGCALDAMIAWRSEPAPELWRFVTVNVARSSRLSRISTPRSLRWEQREVGRARAVERRDRRRFTQAGAITKHPSS